MPEVILHTEHLSKSYATVKAVSDINFSLEKGEVHAIIGANGAGKSTFVKLLFGEVLPSFGKIFIKGKEQKINSPSDALKNSIAMVSQDFGLINSMTIAENLSISNAGSQKSILFNSEKVKSTAENIFSYLSLQLDVTRLVSDLSVSEKQLVAIAKALTVNSEILIFDEPTSVLSSDSFQIIKKLIKGLKDVGKSIIYITHKIDEVFDVADSVSVFRDSKVALTSKINQVSKDDLLQYFNIASQEIPNKLSDKPKLPLLQIEKFSTASLHNISFSISKGEAVGIISDNYNNAAELAKTLYGLTKKTSGTVKINGSAVNGNPSENVKLKIGFIPDDRRTEGIFNNLTVNDNIALMQFKKTSKIGIINNQSILKNTRAKIAQLGVRCKSIFQFASELSGGNQQKVLFARWMSYDFDLLILVEPTAGIDLGGKSEIHFIISDLKKKGKSFLIASSDSDEVKNLCDRVIFLNNGGLKEGSISNEFSNKN